MISFVLNFITRLVGCKEKEEKNFRGFVFGEDIILRFLPMIVFDGAKLMRLLEKYGYSYILHPHNNPVKRFNKRIDFMIKDLFT